jgi:hypothetical protein
MESYRRMKHIAFLLIGGAFLAFAFLLYSLLNLEKLGIRLTHPRILVESGLGILCLAAGVILCLLSQ